jgi:hypothetical protein
MGLIFCFIFQLHGCQALHDLTDGKELSKGLVSE